MNPAGIEILCCQLSAVDDNSLAHYENYLNAEELQRLRNFRVPSGAKEFLVGRALLRNALAERLKCDPRDLQFTKNSDGKPSLSYPVANWHFNLTHSHDWLALALCEGYSIGVDVESYTRRNHLPEIAKRFFSSEENARLAQCPQNEWSDYFFAVWTLKEAHAKALGCGLPKILPYSSVIVDLTAGTIDLKLSGAACTQENIASWLYKFDDQFALALIAHGDTFVEPQIYRCVPLQTFEPLQLQVLARR